MSSLRLAIKLSLADAGGSIGGDDLEIADGASTAAAAPATHRSVRQRRKRSAEVSGSRRRRTQRPATPPIAPPALEADAPTPAATASAVTTSTAANAAAANDGDGSPPPAVANNPPQPSGDSAVPGIIVPTPNPPVLTDTSFSSSEDEVSAATSPAVSATARFGHGLQEILVTENTELPHSSEKMHEILLRVASDLQSRRSANGRRGFRRNFCLTGVADDENDTFVEFHRMTTVLKAMAIVSTGAITLGNDRRKMTRGLFYEHNQLFSKRNHNNEIAKVLNSIALGLGIPTSAFGLANERKGKYDGILAYVYNKGKADESIFDIQDVNNRLHHDSGFDPPSNFVRNRDGVSRLDPSSRTVHLKSSAEVVIILEDGEMFNLVRQDRIWEDKVDGDGAVVEKGIPCILVCSHGHADDAIAAFVSMVTKTFGIPAIGFVDLNVGGVDVLNGFYDGDKQNATPHERLTHDRTRVGWFGMRVDQLPELGLDANELKHDGNKFGPHRLARLANHLAKKTSWLKNAIKPAARTKAMKDLKKHGHGIEAEQIDDETFLRFFKKQVREYLSTSYEEAKNIVV